jgi:S1-C subfamily serine protease
MKTMRRWALAVLALFLLAAAPLAAGEPARKPDTVYQKTLRATAMIVSDAGQGTGWVVSLDKKQLLTCEHVVGKADKVRVIFPAYRDGRVIARRDFYDDAEPITARVVFTDANQDLALLVLDSVPDGVAALKLAAEAPGPGDAVHAVGCPGSSQGLWVYSYGKVRQVTDAEWSDGPRTRRLARVVETQLPLNPGDSGGPLVNDDGELVGVNQGIRSDAQLMSAAIEVGEVKRFLGNAAKAPKRRTAAEAYKLAQEAKARGDWDRAKAYLAETLDREPGHRKALIDLAFLLNETKEYDDAITVCLDGLLLDEKNSDLWREMGFAELRKKDYEEAAKSLLVAVKLNPKERSAWKYLAEVWDILDRPEEAARAREVVEKLSK